MYNSAWATLYFIYKFAAYYPRARGVLDEKCAHKVLGNDLHGLFVFSTKAGHDLLELVLVCQLCIAQRIKLLIGALLATR
jgi:hypothetical protein